MPDGLLDVVAEVRRRLGADEAALAVRFEAWFLSTWRRALDPGRGTVITGDIPAMWPRDATAQLRPCLLAAHDPKVAAALETAARHLSHLVALDPWANAFVVDRRRPLLPLDLPRPRAGVWERKHEVDGPAWALAFGSWVHRATGRAGHLDALAAAGAATVWCWTIEQDHARSPYRFVRVGGTRRDRVGRWGRGRPVGRTGMPWCGFRPSDDACAFGYHVPSSMLAVVALRDVAAWVPGAAHLADEVEAGVERWGVVGGRYVAEVDGLGGVLAADDANVPSLVSIPYLGYRPARHPVVAATRAAVWSAANPWFVDGPRVHGIGSPHTGPGTVWPLSLLMHALTATDEATAWRSLRAAVALAWPGPTGGLPESVRADRPDRRTRRWFGWADALGAETVGALVGLHVPGTGFRPAWQDRQVS